MTRRATSEAYIRSSARSIVTEIRQIANDLRGRIENLRSEAARTRRDSARLRRVPRGEVEVDADLLYAWFAGLGFGLCGLISGYVAAAILRAVLGL